MPFFALASEVLGKEYLRACCEVTASGIKQKYIGGFFWFFLFLSRSGLCSYFKMTKLCRLGCFNLS